MGKRKRDINHLLPVRTKTGTRSSPQQRYLPLPWNQPATLWSHDLSVPALAPTTEPNPQIYNYKIINFIIYFFYCGKSTEHKIQHFNHLNVQFSGIKYVHIMQP